MKRLALWGLTVLAHATSINVYNDTTDRIFIRGMPYRAACVGGFYGYLAPQTSAHNSCNSDRFYGTITIYPPKIFPQYITLAFIGPRDGPMHRIRLVGCRQIPYHCDLSEQDGAITFRLQG